MTFAFPRRGVQRQLIGLTVTALAFVAMYLVVFDYEGMARRRFGSPSRIASIVECFERIEKRPATDFIAATDKPEIFGFPETRMIPASEIPKQLADDRWGSRRSYSARAAADWRTVLAHYDEHHQLRAIEFYGSRYGAFVSRDASLRPTMEGELKQLAGAPVFITARITGGD